jgi:hypothetical protein
MPRIKKVSTIQGDHSFCNCFILTNRKSSSSKYQIKIRLTINNQPVKGALVQKADAPVFYNDEPVKLYPADFDLSSNRAIRGYQNGELTRFNLYLHNLMIKAVAIGDDFFKKKAKITHSLFRDLLYKENVELGSIRERIELNPGKYKFVTEPITVDKQVLQTFDPSKIIDADTGLPIADDELEDALRIEQGQFDSMLESEAIKKMPTKEIYEKGLFDRENIFHVFGSTYFDPKTFNKFYLKIVFRLFEYRERAKRVRI